jgi:hypothetical protein
MLLQQLKSKDRGSWIQEISPHDWIGKLESAIKEGEYSHHPSQALLDLWKTRYGRTGGMRSNGDTQKSSKALTVETFRAQAASPLMKHTKPFDLARVDGIRDWMDRTIPSQGHQKNSEGK